MLQEGNIILRALKEPDAPVLAVLANNRNISCYLRDIFPYPYGPGDAQSFINHHTEQQPVTTFAIEFEGDFCGVISVIPQQDIYRKSAEIGYWLGEPYWGKGIITIATRLITDYGLHQLNFVRIYSGVFDGNLASMRVLEKNGYIKEGIFKKSIYKDGRLFDEHRYAITVNP